MHNFPFYEVSLVGKSFLFNVRKVKGHSALLKFAPSVKSRAETGHRSLPRAVLLSSPAPRELLFPLCPHPSTLHLCMFTRTSRINWKIQDSKV